MLGKYLWVRTIYLLPAQIKIPKTFRWVHKCMINQCRKCRRLPVFCAGGCCALSAFVQVGYLPQFVPSCWLNEHVSYAITQTSRGKHPISLHVLPYSIAMRKGNDKIWVRNGSSLVYIRRTAVCVMIDLLFQEPLHACHSLTQFEVKCE
jgi:hypothetical protein